MENMDIIQIQTAIKSRNLIDKLHWAEKRNLKNDYIFLIRNQMHIKKLKKASYNSRYKLGIYSYRKRLLDPDNLVGGCKQLIDALCDEGFIYDDNPKCVVLDIDQYKLTQNFTIITRKCIL